LDRLESWDALSLVAGVSVGVVLKGELAVSFAHIFNGGIRGKVEVGVIVVLDVWLDHVGQLPRAVRRRASVGNGWCGESA
jgi:hypothetical protein